MRLVLVLFLLGSGCVAAEPIPVCRGNGFTGLGGAPVCADVSCVPMDTGMFFCSADGMNRPVDSCDDCPVDEASEFCDPYVASICVVDESFSVACADGSTPTCADDESVPRCGSGSPSCASL